MRRGITVNTDASYCPETKVGGWACYIISDHFKIKYANQFKKGLSSSQEAEANAIVNALHILTNYVDKVEDYSFIVINTDCKVIVDEWAKGKGTFFDRIINNIAPIVKKFKIEETSIRHVKAHSKINVPRNKVNDWCDAEAKKQMRNARDRKLGINC